MKSIFCITLLVAIASSSPVKEWQRISKSPLEKPKYQEFLGSLVVGEDFSSKVDRGQRIVGGRPAIEGQFPYQVYLYLYDSNLDESLCGGSIISANYVLTAAHCVIGISSAKVHAGSTDRGRIAPWSLEVSSSSFKLHPSYDDDTLINDIAIINCPGIPLNGFTIGVVTLPSRADVNVNLQGFFSTVSGFGRFRVASEDTSQFLLFVQMPVITNAECALYYDPSLIIDSTLCVDTFGGRGTCQGDSGGPLTAVVSGRRIQIGISSFVSKSGCRVNSPAGFARVTSFLDWIEENSDVVIV